MGYLFLTAPKFKNLRGYTPQIASHEISCKKKKASYSLHLLSLRVLIQKGQIQVKATFVYWHADISKRLQETLSYLQP